MLFPRSVTVLLSFGADFIHFNRDYSDAAIARAIDRVFRKYEGNFNGSGMEKPAAEDFRQGRLYCVQIPGLNAWHGHSLQQEIWQALAKNTDRMRVNKSPTAAKVFVTHDDGYSRTNGSGFSAVATAL